MLAYEQYLPGSTFVQTILRLAGTRNSRYRGYSYSLATLLDTYRGHFCLDQRDKVYAFLGMANDHHSGDIPVDYQKPLVEVYQDVLRFQRKLEIDIERKRTEMVYLSAVVRMVLTGQHYKRIKQRPSRSFQSIVAQVFRRFDPVLLQENPSNATGTIFIYALCEAFARKFTNVIWSWLFTQNSYTSAWCSSLPERQTDWLPSNTSTPANDPLNKIRVRALIACRISYLGPAWTELVSSFDNSKRWSLYLSRFYPDDPTALAAAWARHSRLMQVLLAPEDAFSERRIQNITPLDVWDNRSERNIPAFLSFEEQRSFLKVNPLLATHPFFSTSPSPVSAVMPRVFLGTNQTTGLVPYNARIGDLICQFWNSSAAAVVRVSPYDGSLRVIGRAGVVSAGVDEDEDREQRGSRDWVIRRNKKLFATGAPNSVELIVDWRMLTRLSFDTMVLEKGQGST